MDNMNDIHAIINAALGLDADYQKNLRKQLEEELAAKRAAEREAEKARKAEREAERKKNMIKKLEGELDRLNKKLPEVLHNKEKALAVKEERKASGINIYDCSCGNGRTEFCERPVCEYERIRHDEYINGPISQAIEVNNRIAEITNELSRLRE